MRFRKVVIEVLLASEGGALGTAVDLFDQAVALVDELKARAEQRRWGDPGIVRATILSGPGARPRRRPRAQRRGPR